jgi:hypothetical protein
MCMYNYSTKAKNPMIVRSLPADAHERFYDYYSGDPKSSWQGIKPKRECHHSKALKQFVRSLGAYVNTCVCQCAKSCIFLNNAIMERNAIHECYHVP